MSFILDALKKSESERQRQSGPALFEVKVATPRPGFPLWAVALGVLLLVNMGVVLWLVLRKPAHAQAVALPVAPAGVAQATQSPPPVVAPSPQSSPQPAQEISPPVPPAESNPAELLNPEDYEPAANPANATPQPQGTREDTGELPSFEEAAAAPGASLPALRLDMHAYAPNPQDRLVFINAQPLHEGGTLSEGVRVETITPEGVVLSYRGSKFVLTRQ